MTRKQNIAATPISRPQQVGSKDVGTNTQPLHMTQGQKRWSPTTADGQHDLCPQQRYAKRPKHPGMGTFDGTLRQLPLQQRKTKKPGSSPVMKLRLIDRTNVPPETDHSDENCSSDESITSAALRECRKQMDEHGDEPSTINFIRNTTDKSSCGTVFEAHRTTTDTLSKMSASPENALDMSYVRIRTKLIYAMLVDRSDSEGVPQTDAEFHSDQERRRNRALSGLRLNVLQKSHDFFSSSQDLYPNDLKQLAAYYGMTGADHKLEAQQFVRCLKQMSQEYRDRVVLFAGRARVFVDNFCEALHKHKQQWLKVNVYLHRYMHALYDEGFIGSRVFPFSPSEDWSQLHVWTRFAMAPPQSLDDKLRQRYSRQHRAPLPADVELSDKYYRSTILPLEDEALSFLSGWVGFGPRIARDFHDYCHVFTFLAWFGFTYIPEEAATKLATIYQP